MQHRKPSFYTRLSSLIVVQVLFVFAAFVLILFYPNDSERVEGAIEQIEQSVSQSCQLVQAAIEADRLTNLAAMSSSTSAKLKSILTDNSWIVVSELLQTIDGVVVDRKLMTDPDHLAESLLSKFEDKSPAKLVSLPSTHEAYVFSTDNTSSTLWNEHLVHQHNFGKLGGRATSLLVIARHGMVISSRSQLSYFVFLLFLVSSLVSLLTVYLISERVKRPMVRLMSSLKKTAAGESFHMIEDDKDQEFNSLVESFNEMTRQLLTSHEKLKGHNARATAMNIELLRSHNFLATLINSSPYPIIATSPTGEIMMVNLNAMEALGHNEESLMGQPMQSLLVLPADSNSQKGEMQTENSGFEARCHREDGSSFPAFIVVAAIGMDKSAPEGWLYIMRDISESQNFQDMMLQLDRYYTRGKMAGDIAHDINNFLAILGGNIELMPIILRKGDQEKIDKKLTLMKTTVDKIASFADGLMDRPQDQVSLVPSDFNQVIENVLAFMKPQKRLRGIDISLNLTDELPLVPIDRPQIQQMLTNFIFNASDALQELEGEKQVVIKTSVVSNERGRFARCSVWDSGAGVAEECIPNLFNKRFSTKRKGHGIGLVSCRQIVEAHQGDVGYSFEDGALFYCELPIDIVPANLTETTSNQQSVETVG